MFLGIQDFDFAYIQSNLPKTNQFYPNFASILPKYNQICLKLINFDFVQNIFLKDAAASPATTRHWAERQLPLHME